MAHYRSVDGEVWRHVLSLTLSTNPRTLGPGDHENDTEKERKQEKQKTHKRRCVGERKKKEGGGEAVESGKWK